MPTLSDRETELLRAIIEEYTTTADPVGSETIEKKYPKLGVSPATIRNEMVRLTKMGYLAQPHTSSGRIPSSMGLKFYINQLMKEKELSTAEEVAVKDKIWDYRDRMDLLLREATHALADKTKNMAVATTDDGNIYYSGLANILDMPEFYDIELTRAVLSLLDEDQRIQNIFVRRVAEEDIQILFGEELESIDLKPCGFIYTTFETGSKHKGTLGIIGPARLNYSSVIPVLRYINSLLTEMVVRW